MYCFLSSRRRHTRWPRDWSSDVCSSDLDSGVVRQKCGELRIKGLHGIVTVRETGEKLSSNEAYSRILQQPGDYGERIIEETQIGRASCRERGWSGEGEGAVKKRKE